MWIATRHEGFDDPVKGKRHQYLNKRTSDLIERCSQAYLRSGLLMKFLSLIIFLLNHVAYGGKGIFTWDLNNTDAEMRGTSRFRSIVTFASALYFLGAIFIGFFQYSLADDAAWSRGYRAGSKLLSYASFLDISSSAMYLAWACNFCTNYTDNYWHYFITGSIDWLFFGSSRVIQGFSLILMGCALFLLEVYHDTGTNDWHAPLNLFLFTICGFTDIVSLLLPVPQIHFIIYIGSILSALVWAIAFEEEVNSVSPLYHESELCNELEKEVNEFTRVDPQNI